MPLFSAQFYGFPLKFPESIVSNRSSENGKTPHFSAFGETSGRDGVIAIKTGLACELGVRSRVLLDFRNA